MPIAINGSGTVTGISVGGLPDGIVDTDMIAAAAVTAPKRGAGAILQVVSAVKTDTASTASGTPANISGLTPTITTLKANSTILVMMDVKLSVGGYADHAGLNLYRSISGGSAGEIYRGDADGSRGRFSYGAEDMFGNNGDHQVKQVQSSVVDSPAQAAGTAITYSIQWNHLSGQALYLNRDGDNSNDARSPRMASSLILMEISV